MDFYLGKFWATLVAEDLVAEDLAVEDLAVEGLTEGGSEVAVSIMEEEEEDSFNCFLRGRSRIQNLVL